MTCLASVSEAQEYNSFVISVPYDISVPSRYSTALLGCELANGLDLNSFRPWLSTRVALENGQASGVAKFGYDLLGATPDLISLSEKDTVKFRSIYRAGYFELIARCSVEELTADAEKFNIAHVEVGSPLIVDANNTRAEALDESSVTHFSHRLTPTENEAGKQQHPSTATATTSTSSPGLQSLQSILEGQ